MKVSYNWIKDFVNIDVDTASLADMLTGTGLEVEGVEEYSSIPGGLAGMVVGHVLAKNQHPNADRLSVTQVDIGEEEPVQIVCGAPNVEAGQYVAVATVGAVLYSDAGDTFTIKKAKLRGEASHGMICSEKELHLGPGHEGIMVLDKAYPAGTPLNEVFPVYTDTLFEIGLTPNRSDAMSHIGVARDIVAAWNALHPADRKELKLPKPKALAVGSTSPISITIENTEKCPRYSGVVLKNITVGPSPAALKQRLEAVGIRSINNVVDITNYILKEWGQPLHAFDLDAISTQQVVVKTLEEKTPFTTLDGVERKLSAHDLMICNGDEPMCMAGVFGGASSGVTESTKAIFLESAYFSPTGIRQSSTRHDLRTDAARRYEKGGDPNLTLPALYAAVEMLQEYAGAQVEGQVLDVYPKEVEPVSIDVDLPTMYSFIGVELEEATLKGILRDLDIEIVAEQGEKLTLRPPLYRTDVLRPADIAEEVLRIYGFNRVELPGRMKVMLDHTEDSQREALKKQWSLRLTGAGFTEAMTNSISKSAYYADSDVGAVRLQNSMTAELDIMRPDLHHSLLEVVAHNVNRKQEALRLFEFGKTYATDYSQNEYLALVQTGGAATLHPIEGFPSDLFELKGYVEGILESLSIEGTWQEEEGEAPFSYGLCYRIKKHTLVRLGKIEPAIAKVFDVEQAVFFATIDWTALEPMVQSSIKVKPISKFPSVRRDLALLLDRTVSFSQVKEEIEKAAGALLQSVQLFDIFLDEEKLGEGLKSYAVALFFQDAEKTLTDKLVDAKMKKVTKRLEQQLSAKLR